MLYQRHAIVEMSKTALYLLTALVAIVLTVQVVQLLSQAAELGFTTRSLLPFLGFRLIHLLPMLIPAVFFLAILLVLLRSWRHNEMQIWLFNGIGNSAWLRPIVWFLTLPFLIVSGLSFILSPWAAGLATQYQKQLATKNRLEIGRPGFFTATEYGDAVYFAELSPDQKATNIFLQWKQREKTILIVAASSTHHTDALGQQFVLFDRGQRFEEQPQLNYSEVTTFNRYRIRPSERGASPIDEKIAALPSNVLWSKDAAEAKAEWHWRLALPIATLLLGALAVPLSNLYARLGQSVILLIALSIFFSYLNFMKIGETLLSLGKWPSAVGLWPIHAALLLVILILMRINIRPKP